MFFSPSRKAGTYGNGYRMFLPQNGVGKAIFGGEIHDLSHPNMEMVGNNDLLVVFVDHFIHIPFSRLGLSR